MLGIGFIINGAYEGNKFIFAYPPKAQLREQLSKQLQKKNELDFGEQEKKEIERENENDDFFGLSYQFSSEFFMPKKEAMWNSIFQIGIDSLTFINLPTRIKNREFQKYKKDFLKAQNATIPEAKPTHAKTMLIATNHPKRALEAKNSSPDIKISACKVLQSPLDLKMREKLISDFNPNTPVLVSNSNTVEKRDKREKEGMKRSGKLNIVGEDTALEYNNKGTSPLNTINGMNGMNGMKGGEARTKSNSIGKRGLRIETEKQHKSKTFLSVSKDSIKTIDSATSAPGKISTPRTPLVHTTTQNKLKAQIPPLSPQSTLNSEKLLLRNYERILL